MRNFLFLMLIALVGFTASGINPSAPEGAKTNTLFESDGWDSMQMVRPITNYEVPITNYELRIQVATSVQVEPQSFTITYVDTPFLVTTPILVATPTQVEPRFDYAQRPQNFASLYTEPFTDTRQRKVDLNRRLLNTRSNTYATLRLRSVTAHYSQNNRYLQSARCRGSDKA